MTSKVVRDSIIVRVQNIINSQAWDAVILDIENERFKPPQVGDFMAVQFIGSEEEQITIGAPGGNTFRETGDIMIYYAVASGTGSAGALDRLEYVRKEFRATIIDNVVIDAVDPPDTIGQDINNITGNWWAATILISYEFDQRG